MEPEQPWCSTPQGRSSQIDIAAAHPLNQDIAHTFSKENPEPLFKTENSQGQCIIAREKESFSFLLKKSWVSKTSNCFVVASCIPFKKKTNKQTKKKTHKNVFCAVCDPRCESLTQQRYLFQYDVDVARNKLGDSFSFCRLYRIVGVGIVPEILKTNKGHCNGCIFVGSAATQWVLLVSKAPEQGIILLERKHKHADVKLEGQNAGCCAGRCQSKRLVSLSEPVAGNEWNARFSLSSSTGDAGSELVAAET